MPGSHAQLHVQLSTWQMYHRVFLSLWVKMGQTLMCISNHQSGNAVCVECVRLVIALLPDRSLVSIIVVCACAVSSDVELVYSTEIAELFIIL